MKPWKEDSTEDKDVGFYLKLADVIDLLYLSKPKKPQLFIAKHVMNKEMQLLKASSQITTKCGRFWQDTKRGKLFFNFSPLCHTCGS